MTTIIETEKLTKSYGSHRGIIDVDLAVEQGEVFGFLGPNGAGKTTTIRTLLDLIRPTGGRALVFGIESTVDPVAIHRRVGYLPGEFALYDRLTGAQHLEYFANLRGGVDKAYQASLIERFDLDPSRRFKEYSKGNKQKVGARHRPPAPARAAAARRAHLRPRPARPADLLHRPPRGGGGRRDGLPLLATSSPRSRRRADRVAIIREGRLVKVGTVDALRDLAHHQVELRFAGEVPAAAFEALPGVSDVVVDDHVLRLRVAGAITPVVQAAARYELLDFVSREPSLEETFLAQYGREAVEVG